jgi:hypothetical protein
MEGRFFFLTEGRAARRRRNILFTTEADLRNVLMVLSYYLLFVLFLVALLAWNFWKVSVGVAVFLPIYVTPGFLFSSLFWILELFLFLRARAWRSLFCT